jgi:hypothetical protein
VKALLNRNFVKTFYSPILIFIGIYLHCPLIKKSGGGIVAWDVLKKQIENHLVQEHDAFVTTFIDYYGITITHQFPGWEDANKIINKNTKMDFLEKSMKESVDPDFKSRFIPYIQLHKFEGLLFNNIAVFNNIPQKDFVDKAALELIIDNYPNPELINNTPQNSPPYRLVKLINGYRKIVYGV